MTAYNDPLQKLERLARARQAALHKSLVTCWFMIVEGIDGGMLNADNLQKAVDHLSSGRGFGAQEIFLEPWEEQMQLSFLGHEAYCPFEEMMRELQCLLDAYHRPD